MAPDLPTLPSQHEVVSESVESLQAQIKEIEDKWNDELKRLDTARRDKEELEQTLRVLQTFVEYEREATLKMEEMLQGNERRPWYPGRSQSPPCPKTVIRSVRGQRVIFLWRFVCARIRPGLQPQRGSRVPLENPWFPLPPRCPILDDQVSTSVPPLPPTPAKPASKPKRSPNWKSRITSILINTNNHNRTNPASTSPHSFNSTSPFFDDATASPMPNPSRAAKSRKRPSQDPMVPTGWRRTMGSAGSKFANRENRDINRKRPRTYSIPQN
jgi:hypothetical protein